MINLSTQYNGKADTYHDMVQGYNIESTKDFQSLLPSDMKGISVLDLGCGDGRDLSEMQKRGACVSGVDMSSEMIGIARRDNPNADIREESFTNTSFDPETFDWIVTKWAMQTIPDYDEMYLEVVRLLKPGGTLLFLTGHPYRQFVEKKAKGKNYFEKEIVESVLFDGKVIVREPTHTMAEVLSPFFLSHFDMEAYHEENDTAAEVIDGDIYPSYVLIKAVKR